jgi:hypothetical protein
MRDVQVCIGEMGGGGMRVRVQDQGKSLRSPGCGEKCGSMGINASNRVDGWRIEMSRGELMGRSAQRPMNVRK